MRRRSFDDAIHKRHNVHWQMCIVLKDGHARKAAVHNEPSHGGMRKSATHCAG